MPSGGTCGNENTVPGGAQAPRFVYMVAIHPVHTAAPTDARELAGSVALTEIAVHRMHGRTALGGGAPITWRRVADEWMLGTDAAVSSHAARQSAGALLAEVVGEILASATPAFDPAAWTAETRLWHRPE